MALGLSDNGAIVTVLARRKDRLDAVVKELPKVALCLMCNVPNGFGPWVREQRVTYVTNPHLVGSSIRPAQCADVYVQKQLLWIECVCSTESATRIVHDRCKRTRVLADSSSADIRAASVKQVLTVSLHTAQGHGVITDLFKIDEVEAGVEEAIQKMGGLDILVNNGA